VVRSVSASRRSLGVFLTRSGPVWKHEAAHRDSRPVPDDRVNDGCIRRERLLGRLDPLLRGGERDEVPLVVPKMVERVTLVIFECVEHP
jgi:hypothetical protein